MIYLLNYIHKVISDIVVVNVFGKKELTAGFYIRKHSFSHRTINEWNKLSTDCVTASSVNMFKNKVDTYLRRAGYK